MYLPALNVLAGFPGEAGNGFHHKVVIRDAVCVASTMFGGGDPPTGPKQIQVGFRQNNSPMTENPPGHYEIWLSADAWDHCKIVFQISHEYAHIMFHANRADGIVETLCCAVSLEALRQMKNLWRWCRRPEESTWRQHFTAYLPGTLYSTLSEQPKQVLPNGPSPMPDPVRYSVLARDFPALRTYWQQHRQELDVDPCYRPLNMLGAVLLLESPVNWPALVGLGNHMVANTTRNHPYNWDLPATHVPQPLQ
jgi:hypothetical protein